CFQPLSRARGPGKLFHPKVSVICLAVGWLCVYGVFELNTAVIGGCGCVLSTAGGAWADMVTKGCVRCIWGVVCVCVCVWVSVCVCVCVCVCVFESQSCSW